MPNLVPPVVTADQALAYRGRIEAAMPEGALVLAGKRLSEFAASRCSRLTSECMWASLTPEALRR